MSFDFDSEEIGQRFAELETRVDKLEYTRLLHAFGLVLICVVCAVLLLLHGCYDAHAAEPCDAEVLSDSSTVELPTVNREDAGSSPAWTATPCIPYNPRDCFCQEPTHVYCKAGTQTWEQYADFLANTD